jgi:hypothetical protein
MTDRPIGERVNRHIAKQMGRWMDRRTVRWKEGGINRDIDRYKK